MTLGFRSILPVLLCLAAVLAAPGCATVHIDARRQASVLFDQVPSAEVLVSEVHACPDGEALVVYGKVKRTAANCCDAAHGHLDMAIITPDGSLLDAVSLVYSPRNIPKVRTRSSRFAVRLPYAVPAGTTLRLAYHDDHNLIEIGDNSFACRQSAALDGIEG